MKKAPGEPTTTPIWVRWLSGRTNATAAVTTTASSEMSPRSGTEALMISRIRSGAAETSRRTIADSPTSAITVGMKRNTITAV